MASQSAATLRKPRADGVRNRERVLEAAKAVFSAGGSDASLEAVAKRAGVGIELAEQLKSAPEPVDALRRWLKANVELVATKKGMISALALAVQASSELYAYSFDRLTKAIATLLNRAVAAGELRADIGPEDLLRALIGMCYLHDQPGWQSTVLRLMDVFIDGLRVKAKGGGKAKSPPRKSVKSAKRRQPPSLRAKRSNP